MQVAFCRSSPLLSAPLALAHAAAGLLPWHHLPALLLSQLAGALLAQLLLQALARPEGWPSASQSTVATGAALDAALRQEGPASVAEDRKRDKVRC